MNNPWEQEWEVQSSAAPQQPPADGPAPWEQNWQVDQPPAGTATDSVDPAALASAAPPPTAAAVPAGPPPLREDLDKPGFLERMQDALTNPDSPIYQENKRQMEKVGQYKADIRAGLFRPFFDIPRSFMNWQIMRSESDMQTPIGPFDVVMGREWVPILKSTEAKLKALEDKWLPQAEGEVGFDRMLAQGLGSAGSFMLGGAGLTKLGMNAFSATAAMGGAIGAQNQLDDAIAAGADPNEAQLAFVGGGLVGTSEAISMGGFLNKVNKLTKGRLVEEIQKRGIGNFNSPFWEAVKGLAVEGSQEAMQTVGENFVASTFSGYDPTRSLGKNFWESFLVGGLLGGGIGYGVGRIRAEEEKRILADLEDQFQKMRNDPDLINSIEGAMMPVEEYLKINALAKDASDALDARGTEAQQKYDVELALAKAEAKKQSPTYDTLMADRADYDVNFASHATTITPNHMTILGQQVDPRLEPAWKGKTYAEAAAEGGNIIAPVTLYDADIAALEATLKPMEEAYKLARDKNRALPLPPGIKAVREQIAELKMKTRIGNDLLKQIRAYVHPFLQKLGMHGVVVGDRMTSPDPGYYARQPSTKGSMSFYPGTFTNAAGESVPIGMIWVNLDDHITNIYIDRKLGLAQSGQRSAMNLDSGRELFHIVNHELGHLIIFNALYNLRMNATNSPAAAQQGDRLRKALGYEYLQWLRKQIASANAEPYYQHVGAFPSMVASANSGLSSLTPPDAMDPSYRFSFHEFMAEQISRLASLGKLEPMTLTTQFFQYLREGFEDIYNAIPEADRLKYAGSLEDYFRMMTTDFAATEAREMAAAGGGKDIFDALQGGIPGIDPKKWAGVKDHLDRFNKLISLGSNLLQMARLNPHIPGLQQYSKSVVNWQNYQRNFQLEADTLLQRWRKLHRDEGAALSDVFKEETLQKKPFDAATLSNRLSAEALEVYTGVRQQLDRVLNEMEAAAKTDAAYAFADNTELQKAEIEKIEDDFKKMRDRGYFPLIRFGELTLTVRAKEALQFDGEDFEQGELISFQTFEDEKELFAAQEEMQRELGAKAAVVRGKMRESEHVIQGMPRALIAALKQRLEKLGTMSPEERKVFEDAAAAAMPFKTFKKHFFKRRGVHGYSEDLMRSFAQYISSAAGHISRVKYAEDLRSSLEMVQNDVKQIQLRGGITSDSSRRQGIHDWMKRHLTYIMSPENELAALRGVGFVAFLGFNVKSAFVNMTQLVTTVYPYLAARYGDLNTVGAMSRGSLIVKDWVQNRGSYIGTMATSARKARIGSMFAQGLHEGWIDQSLAAELAIARSESNIDRAFTSTSRLRRGWYKFSSWSALPFHLVEKMNRLVTAVAAYELEYARTQDHDAAVIAAREANRWTNYENSRWNRPEFMRGKKSAAMLFMNFVQNQVFFATQDAGATRYLLMMVLLAGLMGLPGAEDVEDLLDFSVNGLNKMLGIPGGKFQLERELREMLETLRLNPDLIMHGLSQNSFGWGHVGALSGMPIPQFDVSGSIGMGNILPMTEIPEQLMQSRDPMAVLGRAVESAAGAGGSLVVDLYENLFSASPWDWKKVEKMIPLVSLRNILRAQRIAQEGMEQTRDGSVIASFDTDDPRDFVELLGLGLGFQPTRLSAGWQREILERDQVAYWKYQQVIMMNQLKSTFMSESTDAMADIREKVLEYNARVPNPEMKMSNDLIRDSLRQHLTEFKKREVGVAAEKKYARLEKRVAEAFPDPWGNDRNAVSDPP